jgi:anti-sigma regulatory factor (Ser/Thr protein kinase)
MTVLRDGPSGPRAARADARKVCADHGVDDDRTESAVLVLSELVGNAVRHGTPPVSYTTGLDRDDVLLTVDDGTSAPPLGSAGGDPDAESGRGLLLVTSLSRSWGWRPLAGGKQVWARV